MAITSLPFNGTSPPSPALLMAQAAPPDPGPPLVQLTNPDWINLWRIQVPNPAARPDMKNASTHTIHGAFPFHSLARELLTMITKADPAAFLLPIADTGDPSSTKITAVADILKGDLFTIFFANMHEVDNGRNLIFYINIHSLKCLNQMKYDGAFYAFLRHHHIRVSLHRPSVNKFPSKLEGQLN
jgi:hypothetical protein